MTAVSLAFEIGVNNLGPFEIVVSIEASESYLQIWNPWLDLIADTVVLNSDPDMKIPGFLNQIFFLYVKLGQYVWCLVLLSWNFISFFGMVDEA